MKSVILIAVVILFCIIGCDKGDIEEPEVFQVEVLGKGMDCGDNFLIRFKEEDKARINRYLNHTSTYFPVFYAVNLKEEYKEAGLYLNVRIEKIADNEIPGCTAWGPGYGHVWIKESVPESLTFP